MNLTDLFTSRLHTLSAMPIENLPYKAAKESIMDFVGVALGGSFSLKREFANFLDQFDPSDEASVIGFGHRAGLYNAALVNAFSSHILELDDGNRFCAVHLAATVIPAVLAAAEHQKACGERLMRAVIVGYEAAVRIGTALQPGHRQAGFHATGTCGTIGAAMGTAVILGYDLARMKATLSAACTSAAGLLEIQEDDSQLKPYNAAKAAANGLAAAYIAGTDFSGPEDILAGERGFLRLFAPSFKTEPIAAPLERPYGIETIYRKPYAACRHAHAPIDGALKLRKQRAPECGVVELIEVFTHKYAIQGHDHTQIRGATSAKMSIPYSVAVAYLTGEAGMEAFFDDRISNPKILALTECVTVKEDPSLTALTPQRRPAIVKITFSDGQSLTERIDYAKGEPETPLSDTEMEEKFRSLAHFAQKDPVLIDRLIGCIRNLEQDTEGLYQLLGSI
jgi:2-methylcitrate dehydratase PrpD